ncbi:hypothetical protein [Nocardia cyriacigeorgica]|uniref:Uncharacterized protein n=1 Tax=Nocardia cyriacigeorgica TaxID=135487 RepID=A0A6P1D6H9_9NOCA|nr:hypothetical protein [Nocardia cyriacigeorgica]NEW44453.1 hypothetical protein [Nocardia cyriacigeorgica]
MAMISAVQAAFIVSLPLNTFAVTKYLMLGRRALSWNFSPVFGIALPRRLVLIGNVAAPPGVSVALVALSERDFLRNVVVIGLLGFWLLCKNLRVSNHSFLAVVTIVMLSLSSDRASAAATTAAVLAAMYAAAGIAKLNRGYLRGERSLGRRVVELNLNNNSDLLARTPAGLRRLMNLAAMVVVPGAEIILAVAMIVGAPLLWCLLVGLLLHFAFGISGNFEFSMVAVAVWLALVVLSQPVSLGQVVDRVVSAGPGTVVYLAMLVAATGAWQCTWHYLNRRSGLINELFAALFFGVLSLASLVTVDSAVTVAVGVVPLLLTLMSTVGAVVVGARLEFAFAMLSNLRPYGTDWIYLVPRPLIEPRYYFLRLPQQIPVSLLSHVPPVFLKAATSGEMAVHRSTATWLARAFRDHGATLVACRALADPRLGRMMPMVAEDISGWTDLSSDRACCLLFPPLIPAVLSDPVVG